MLIPNGRKLLLSSCVVGLVAALGTDWEPEKSKGTKEDCIKVPSPLPNRIRSKLHGWSSRLAQVSTRSSLPSPLKSPTAMELDVLVPLPIPKTRIRVGEGSISFAQKHFTIALIQDRRHGQIGNVISVEISHRNSARQVRHRIERCCECAVPVAQEHGDGVVSEYDQVRDSVAIEVSGQGSVTTVL